MALCGCCQKRELPDGHVYGKDTKWKFVYSKFFGISLISILVFLGMQYGFSALVMKQQLIWLRIRNMHSVNTAGDQNQLNHNVTDLVWNSTDYRKKSLSNNTIKLVQYGSLQAATNARDQYTNTTAQIQTTAPTRTTATTQTTASKQATEPTSTRTMTTAQTTAWSQVLVLAQTTTQPRDLPQCPPLPPNLVGRQRVSTQDVSREQLEQSHTNVLPGGQWRPLECKSRYRVALIIPYRNREKHLRIFLNYIHPFLQKQQLDYGIYVVEQAPGSKFNRAMLMNIGFVEASKLYDYQCYIFHDVDLLPEDDRNIYSCPEQPRHMSAAVSTMRYRLPYATIVGGVAAMKAEHFRLVNGFSNKFFGWGGEDDDFYNRIHHHHLKLIRYPIDIARYTMLRHDKDTANPQRFKMLYSGAKRFATDGLSSLQYKLQDVENRKLSTGIKVKIDQLR